MDPIIQSKINKLKKQNSEIANKIWSDMFNSASIYWQTGGPNSGTSGAITGTSKHPGIISYSSSSSANSGFYQRITGILLVGGEKTTFIFKTASTLTGIIRRMGFHDSNDQNEPVDGVYAEIVDGVIRGKTANNSTRSQTGTTFSIATDTWYRLVIQLNADATQVTYTLYADDSSTVLWQDTLSANIPTTTGRETGHGDICININATAIVLGYLDYMDVILPNARKVV